MQLSCIYTVVTGDDRKQDKSTARTLENVLIIAGRRLSVVSHAELGKIKDVATSLVKPRTTLES